MRVNRKGEKLELIQFWATEAELEDYNKRAKVKFKHSKALSKWIRFKLSRGY